MGDRSNYSSSYARTLPPLTNNNGSFSPSPFPPLLAQRPAPYNAHIHPVPPPSQLEPIHPPPQPNWRRDERREFDNGYYPPAYNTPRRDSYSDARSSRVVPSVQEMPKDVDDNMPPTSDFVKKLYKMLEDPQFSHVVTWGPQGDCFVVKDVTEFTKSILPRMFKHSNFASFVRQLNKYDFHKLKNAEAEAGGMGYGDQSWTFKHPDFRADDREALENIKRKVPAARKGKNAAPPPPANQPATPVAAQAKTEVASPPAGDSPAQIGDGPRESEAIRMLMTQIETLRQSQETTRRAHEEQIEGLRRTAEDMSAHIRNLETNYQNVLGEIVHFQRNMANQDNLMQNLIGYFIGMENKKNSAAGEGSGDGDPQNQFISGTDASKIFDLGAQDVARASFEQMSEISRRAEGSRMSFGDNPVSMPGMQNQMPTQPGLGNMASAMANQGMGNQNQMANQAMASQSSNVPNSGMQNQAQMSGQGPNSGAAVIGGKSMQQMSREELLGRVEDLQRERPDQQPFTHSGFLPMLNSQMDQRYAQQRKEEESHKGLQVITLGQLVPRDGEYQQQQQQQQQQQGQGMPQQAQQQQQQQAPQMAQMGVDSYNPPANYHGPTPSTSNPSPSGSMTLSPGGAAKSLRVRRSTYVPCWAVPPRVLLVDDDAVNLRLSKKFLQVFGCMIDVAVDGVGAVDKMNLEKYDLVLMDIVMPKMDGISATSIIRRFDHMTPIISMTSNSKPNEIMTYYSSGMNDILPKPFSKEGLFEMLEKHLMHLKQIHQLGQFPRSVSIPPMNDQHMIDYMQHHESNASSSKLAYPSNGNGNKSNGMFSNGFSSYDDDGDPAKVSPFAALGLNEDSYHMIIGDMMGNQETANGGFFGGNMMGGQKRGIEDDGEDGGVKRPRFEEIVD